MNPALDSNVLSWDHPELDLYPWRVSDARSNVHPAGHAPLHHDSKTIPKVVWWITDLDRII